MINNTNEKGITLIALIITIVILIILSTITINLAFGENGLIQRAEDAKVLTDQATTEEQGKLNDVIDILDEILQDTGTEGGGSEGGGSEEDSGDASDVTKVSDAIKNEEKCKDTTKVKDDLNNIIIIPGGFTIAKDSGTKVEDGIVIEDVNKNQFVWIPVGTYNVSNSEGNTITLTNNLSRRTFSEDKAIEVSGDEKIVLASTTGYGEYHYYGEGAEASEEDEYFDKTGIDINSFKASVAERGGFYIGRYEAGTETERTSNNVSLTKPLVQNDKYSYVRISRDEAIEQANDMYNADDFVVSQLISSYAWDTALNFICQTNEEGYTLAITNDSRYGNIATGVKQKTGQYKVENETSDVYSNIYDLLGNCTEWTTEFQAYQFANGYVYRGGNYAADLRIDTTYPSYRISGGTATKVTSITFRIQLYVK